MSARIPGLGADIPVSRACELVAQMFALRGLDSPQADARILVGHALGIERAALLSQGEREIDAREAQAIAARAARRLRHEPVARIVGTKEFWSLPLRVEPCVLVPRPDSETVVELALDGIAPRGTQKLRILDIGTGSGALLLALLSELKSATGIGTDISAEAIAVAWSAQLRLHRTWTRLEQRAKRRTIIAVAVARELTGFCWAVTRIE